MPSYKTAFPSKYIKAEDVGARPVATIATVDVEDIGAGQNKESKLVVHFEEASLKPLVLNKINSDTIAEIAGSEDYDLWPGTKIQLFGSKTEFQGKRVACIRVQEPPVAASPLKATRKPAPARVVDPNDSSSDVGF